MANGRRQYTDMDRATALATLEANGGDCSKTSRELGVPRQTLQEWAAGRGVPVSVPELRQEKRADLADRWEKVANAALDVLDRHAQDLRPRDAATVGGIATDKMVLLRGDAPPAAAVVVIVTGPGLGDL